MLKAYHTDQGHELAVTWLFSLYKQQTRGGKGGSSLLEGAPEGGNRGDTTAGASVKAEEAGQEGAGAGAAAAAGVSKEQGQVKKEGEQEGATAMEIDSVRGKSHCALCKTDAIRGTALCVKPKPDRAFLRSGISEIGICRLPVCFASQPAVFGGTILAS